MQATETNPRTGNDEDIREITDCFNYVAELTGGHEGSLLLTDDKKNILSIYTTEKSGDMNADEAASLKINLNLEYAKQKRSVSIDNKESDIYIYTSKALAFCGSYYYIAAFTLSENDQIKKRLEDITGWIEKLLRIVGKHGNNHARLIEALDAVNDGVSICDSSGEIIYTNNACVSIFGVEKEELLNENVDSIMEEKTMLSQVLKTRKSMIDAEYYFKFRGRSIGLICSGYPIFHEKGYLVGAIDIYRSIERSRILANKITGYHAFFTFDDIVGESENIKEIISLAKLYSPGRESILIEGESGTGKELLAQSIHNYSERRSQPFIALNCANFPNELIDSELFGYEEGAFTGAKKGGKTGKFELADGGTLFLDEIGEMQIHLQAKLLRVLETMCIDRISGSKPIPINVRIITATNRKLEKLVEEGKFREDLYYRLKVLYLEVPPLRERGNDILILADYFIGTLGAKMNKMVKALSPEAKELFMKNPWNGNIRELENTISRLLFLCDGDFIDSETLKKAGLIDMGYTEIKESKSVKVNKLILEEVLRSTGGNMKKTAESLGVSRPTLYKLVKKYGLQSNKV
jgi:PAS domain S-box-containing protein